MKNFFISTILGIIFGVGLGYSFLYIAPKLSDVFAQLLYYPVSDNAIVLIQDAKHLFKPDASQFFIQSADDSISTSTKVLYADLGAMTISLYEEGKEVKQFPIQSIGREGTAWQTPIGIFDMSFKEKNHFSSIGHVWMPYSMHFFGNYFIHGWPYYDNGDPVAQGYSGGCIRLKTDDSEKIFNFVDIDTQLIVTTNKKPNIQKEFQYIRNQSIPVSSDAYLIADLHSGEVLASSKSNISVPAQSFTKIMTGLISLETLNQYQEAILNQDIVKISDVLYALLLADDNEAGRILYEQKNKAQYLKDMNTRAESLAMKDTLYTDPNGVEDTTQTTLEDTFRLLQYIYTYKPFLFKVLSLSSYDFGTFVQNSIHPLQHQVGYLAGFSNQNKTELVTVVSLDINKQNSETKEKRDFVIIVQSQTSTSVETMTKDLYTWLVESVEIRSK